MLCPFCNSKETNVKDSRNIEEGRVVRRRRYCLKCKSRFSTYERIQLREILVVKKSGLKKPFDRDKIISSISTAVRKRKISVEQINQIADEIFRELENNGAKEFKTKIIGEMIMNKLIQIDPVAYIRFASVYKDFTRVSDFANLIGNLKNKY